MTKGVQWMIGLALVAIIAIVIAFSLSRPPRSEPVVIAPTPAPTQTPEPTQPPTPTPESTSAPTPTPRETPRNLPKLPTPTTSPQATTSPATPAPPPPTGDGTALIPRPSVPAPPQAKVDNAIYVAFAPDGRLLIARASGRIDIVDLVTGQKQAIGLSIANPRGIALAPDGGRVAVAHAGGADVWHIVAASRTHLDAGDVRAIAFMPNGAALATADASGVIKIWDATSWATTSTLAGAGAVTEMKFFPGGRYLVTSGGGVNVWNLADRKIEKSLTTAACPSIDVAPDERTLVTASDKGAVLWEPAFWQTRATLGEGSTQVAFWRGGSVLVSAGTDGVIKIWDMPTRGLLTPLSGMNGPITSMSLSPDNRNVAACGAGGVMLWDSTTRASRKID